MPFRFFRSVLNNFKCFGAGKARAFLLRPFPAASRRIPRARRSPRAKEQAMPALRRPLPAFPSPVKCRRCPPRPPVFRPLRRRQIFCPPFPRAGCFLFVLPQMRRVSSVPRRMRGRKAGQMRRGADVFSHLRPFLPIQKDFPLFRTAKIILSLPLLSLPHKRPPSQSKVLCPKAPRQKTRPPNPRHNRTFLEGQRQSALRRTFVRRRAL